MGRDLQKRKNRSSRPTVRQSSKPKKPLNPRGNNLIAKNWNKTETLSQNYRRLGLTSRLGKVTGGIEQHRTTPNGTTRGAPPTQDPLAVTPASGMRGAVRAVKVERDADGKIIRVLHRENPLNDPLNDLEDSDDDDDGEEEKKKTKSSNNNNNNRTTTKVVDLLELEANLPTEKHIRHQSSGEREWLERLVAKHGDDASAMARDLKLNPMQQTAADIRKRLRTYKEELGI